MANIIKRIMRIFNGTEWEKYYPETSSDQVVHTKADGTATTVQEELLAQNSALMKTTQFSYTDVSVSANTPLLLKNFSIDGAWNGRNIIGIIPVSIRGHNTSSFIPSLYRQYSSAYFVSTITQLYDIVINVIYI